MRNRIQEQKQSRSERVALCSGLQISLSQFSSVNTAFLRISLCLFIKYTCSWRFTQNLLYRIHRKCTCLRNEEKIKIGVLVFFFLLNELSHSTLENPGSSKGYTSSCCNICVLSFSVIIKLLILCLILTVMVFSRKVLINSKTLFSFIEVSDSQTMAPRPTISSSLGNLLKCKFLGPTPEIQNQRFLGVGPSNLF